MRSLNHAHGAEQGTQERRGGVTLEREAAATPLSPAGKCEEFPLWPMGNPKPLTEVGMMKLTPFFKRALTHTMPRGLGEKQQGK